LLFGVDVVAGELSVVFGPTLSSVIPLALPSRTDVLGRYKQHACQALCVAVRCDKVSPARPYCVTQCALRSSFVAGRLAAPPAGTRRIGVKTAAVSKCSTACTLEGVKQAAAIAPNQLNTQENYGLYEV
jgi:hypothetical protein